MPFGLARGGGIIFYVNDDGQEENKIVQIVFCLARGGGIFLSMLIRRRTKLTMAKSRIQIIVILQVIHLPGFQSLKPKKQYTRRVSGLSISLSSHQILSPGDYPDALR